MEIRGPALPWLLALEPPTASSTSSEPDLAVEPVFSRPPGGSHGDADVQLRGDDYMNRSGHRCSAPDDRTQKVQPSGVGSGGTVDASRRPRGQFPIALEPASLAVTPWPQTNRAHPDPTDALSHGGRRVTRCHVRSTVQSAGKTTLDGGSASQGGADVGGYLYAHRRQPRRSALVLQPLGQGVTPRGRSGHSVPPPAPCMSRVDAGASVASAMASLVGWPRTGCAHGRLRSPPLWYS